MEPFLVGRLVTLWRQEMVTGEMARGREDGAHLCRPTKPGLRQVPLKTIKRWQGRYQEEWTRAGKRLQALESRGVYLNRWGKGKQRPEPGPQAEDSRTLGNTVSAVLPAARWTFVKLSLSPAHRMKTIPLDWPMPSCPSSSPTALPSSITPLQQMPRDSVMLFPQLILCSHPCANLHSGNWSEMSYCFREDCPDLPNSIRFPSEALPQTQGTYTAGDLTRAHLTHQIATSNEYGDHVSFFKLIFWGWGSPHFTACGISFPDQESHPQPLQWEHSLTLWTAREVSEIRPFFCSPLQVAHLPQVCKKDSKWLNELTSCEKRTFSEPLGIREFLCEIIWQGTI